MIKVYLESAGLDLLMRETKTPRGQYLEFHFANRPTIPRTRYNFRRLMAEMPAQYSAAPRKMVELARVVVEGYFEKNRVKELVEGQPGRYSEAEVRDQDESYGRWAEGKDKTPVDEDEEGNAASDTESDAGSEDSSISLNANIGGFGAIRSLERNDSATMRAWHDFLDAVIRQLSAIVTSGDEPTKGKYDLQSAMSRGYRTIPVNSTCWASFSTMTLRRGIVTRSNWW